MAETWPDDLRPQQIGWGCVYNSRAFTSTLSNSQQVVSYPGAYWRCSMQFSALTRERARRLSVLVGRLRGMAGTVNVPIRTRLRTDNIGAPVVASAATNAFAISMTGLIASGVVFRAGDYLTVAGQLYEVVEDASANGADALVTVNKRIRSSIAPGTPIEYRNPYCEMRLMDDSFSENVQPIISSSSLQFREAF
ncbi:hypothetical protein [Stutzerimonas nitrititolerans]|uniref:hypothetical protein n=1 Tax=Stutzerimonas nitrititolerans TaxID=2482751 RepID=UPI0028AB3C35|nr:hypothetical protein [Stutzerimonas nitrititolerans]